MICRSVLKRLQGQRDYPSLSLLAPTHRTAPANKKDRIVVKNLAAQGLSRLQDEFKKREVAALVKNLNGLVNRVDWEHHSRDWLFSPAGMSRPPFCSRSARGRGS